MGLFNSLVDWLRKPRIPANTTKQSTLKHEAFTNNDLIKIHQDWSKILSIRSGEVTRNRDNDFCMFKHTCDDCYGFSAVIGPRKDLSKDGLTMLRLYLLAYAEDDCRGYFLGMRPEVYTKLKKGDPDTYRKIYDEYYKNGKGAKVMSRLKEFGF